MTGTLRPDQFEDYTGAKLPTGDWQTVAGYAIDAFDEIPAAGDTVVTELGQFTVVEMDGFAIATLRVRLTAG